MPLRKLLFAVLLPVIAVLSAGVPGKSQFTIRPTAQEELILAVPDVQPLRSDQAADLAPALATFNEVLWDDLKFSGFFTLAGKSFYPPQPIVRDEDLNYDAWSALPFKLSFLTAGTIQRDGKALRAQLKVFDMKQRTMSFGLRIDDESGEQVRSMAHRWADEIVYRLTAGASRGIASTRIAYSSRRGGPKEIYIMDYDGNDQHAFTRNGSLNLFPKWSPDNTKLAFLSYRTDKPQINIYSVLDGSRLPFPIFDRHVSNPVISPDGQHLLFQLGSDICVSNLDGSDRRNITNSSAINTSPTWSPSGRQIAFMSDRDGIPQIYICDADGANVRRIVKEGGESDWPAWSPDGRWIAFHWKPRMAESFDIYIAEVSTGQIRQLTSGAGSNECPSWAPDSRHLAFQSDRSGSYQIYIMLADTNNPELRMVTSQGTNSCPAWSSYPPKS